MKTFLTVLLLCLCHPKSFAQLVRAWDKHYTSGLQLVDYAREVQSDAAGNVYIGGHSLVNVSQEGITTVVKYDSNGVFQWVYSSSMEDYMEDMTVAPSGNVYCVGITGNSPATNDILVVKINPSGTVAWRDTINGPGDYYDYGTAVHIDAAENVYVGGNASTVVNGMQFTAAKYNAAGQRQWVSAFPSLVPSYQNNAFDIITDIGGNVFLNGYQKVGDHHFLTMVKFNAAGALQWWDTTATHHEWNSIDHTYSAADHTGNVYLAGNTRLPGTGCDILLVKFNGSGKAWTRTWNNPGNDSNYVCGGYYIDEALAVDGSGNVLIAGTTSYRNNPYEEDIVTLKYTPQGNLLWTHTFNGAGDDEDWPFGIALDPAGNPHICGSSNYGSNFGDTDFLTYKLNGQNGALLWQDTYNYTGNFVDQPHAIHVDARSNVYVTGAGAANQSILDPETHMVTIKYRPVVTAGLPAHHRPLSWTVFPNPADQAAAISLTLEKSAAVTCRLFNQAGQLVREHAAGTLPAGRQVLRFPTGDLAAGVYTCVLEADQKKEARPLMIRH